MQYIKIVETKIEGQLTPYQQFVQVLLCPSCICLASDPEGANHTEVQIRTHAADPVTIACIIPFLFITIQTVGPELVPTLVTRPRSAGRIGNGCNRVIDPAACDQ